MSKIDVLNAGFVRLVDHMGNDLSIARNARVSYDAEWRAGEDEGSDARLINYLYKNGHNTPFESVVFTFEVKAPIFVIRQWHRHRTWAYNEVSARYTKLPTEYYLPNPVVIGEQSKDNKQMRDVPLTMDKSTLKHNQHSVSLIEAQCAIAFSTYNILIERGVPRELARSVLPVATYTHMFGTVNLNNLFKFLGERMHSHAQYEIREYANAMLELIRPIVPVAVAAFEKNFTYE